MQSNIIVTAVVVIYLLVMLLIGYLSSKKIESNTDFVVAGRRLGPLLMAGHLLLLRLVEEVLSVLFSRVWKVTDSVPHGTLSQWDSLL